MAAAAAAAAAAVRKRPGTRSRKRKDPEEEDLMVLATTTTHKVSLICPVFERQNDIKENRESNDYCSGGRDDGDNGTGKR